MQYRLFDITQNPDKQNELLLDEFSKEIEFSAGAIVWHDAFLKIPVIKFSRQIEKSDLILLKEHLLDAGNADNYIKSLGIHLYKKIEQGEMFYISEKYKFLTTVPLISENEAVGLILLYSEAPGKKTDRIKLDDLIDRATVFIKNNISYSIQNEMYVVANTIFEISQKINMENSANEIILYIFDFLKIVFNVPELNIYNFKDDAFFEITQDGSIPASFSEQDKKKFLEIDGYKYDAKNKKFYVALFDSKEYYGLVIIRGIQDSPILFSAFEMILPPLVSAMKNCYIYEHAFRTTMYDFVTGIYSKGYFEKRYAEELKRAKRYNIFFSLLYMDVDEFKRIREMYNERVCDGILKKFGDLLKNTMRSTDLVARMSWQEFIVLLPNTDIDGANIAANRLKATINNTAFDSFKLTASIGISNFPFDSNEYTGLIDMARKGMLRAKKHGGNLVEYAGKLKLE